MSLVLYSGLGILIYGLGCCFLWGDTYRVLKLTCYYCERERVDDKTDHGCRKEGRPATAVCQNWLSCRTFGPITIATWPLWGPLWALANVWRPFVAWGRFIVGHKSDFHQIRRLVAGRSPRHDSAD